MSWFGSFFGDDKRVTPDADSSILDVVTYVASLASDPHSVDPLLDPLRILTARLQPGQPLSSKEQEVLAGVYRRLEEHLITEDPLRTFDALGLREKINSKFPKRRSEESAFWDAIEFKKG